MSRPAFIEARLAFSDGKRESAWSAIANHGAQGWTLVTTPATPGNFLPPMTESAARSTLARELRAWANRLDGVN